jgi:hypothetical protein
MTSSLTEEQLLYVRKELELTEKRIIEGFKSKTKTKTKKDPMMPKKPVTSYTLFCSDLRAGLKETEPTMSFGETAKKLGEMWRAVDDTTRAKYDKKSAKEKEKYEIALESYTRIRSEVTTPELTTPELTTE